MSSTSSLNVVVRATRDLPFSCEDVFDAWVTEGHARHFFFASPIGELQSLALDVREGGAFTVVDRRIDEDVTHTGEYVTLDRGKLLVFTFRIPAYSDESSRVSVTFEPVANGCRTTIDAGAVPAEVHARAAQGWGRMLERVEEALRNASRS